MSPVTTASSTTRLIPRPEYPAVSLSPSAAGGNLQSGSQRLHCTTKTGPFERRQGATRGHLPAMTPVRTATKTYSTIAPSLSDRCKEMRPVPLIQGPKLSLRRTAVDGVCRPVCNVPDIGTNIGNATLDRARLRSVDFHGDIKSAYGVDRHQGRSRFGRKRPTCARRQLTKD